VYAEVLTKVRYDLRSAKIIKKGLVPQAFKSFSISNFFILRKALTTLSDLEGSFIRLARNVGTICHETPNLSFSQPHWTSSPPLVSFSQ
jgi:hypothetical protein